MFFDDFAGYRTLGVYLRAEGNLLATARHPVWGYIDAKLPPAARLLGRLTIGCDGKMIWADTERKFIELPSRPLSEAPRLMAMAAARRALSLRTVRGRPVANCACANSWRWMSRLSASRRAIPA